LTIETALLGRIATSTSYSSSFMTSGDYRVLGYGLPRAVIAKFAGLDRRDLTFRIVRDEWLVNLDVYTRYNGELRLLADDMDADRQEIVDTIAKWPALNNSTGVYRAQVRPLGPPVMPTPDFPHYGLQTVVVSVVETYDPGRLEP
jgi:hypothetical protein